MAVWSPSPSSERTPTQRSPSLSCHQRTAATAQRCWRTARPTPASPVWNTAERPTPSTARWTPDPQPCTVSTGRWKCTETPGACPTWCSTILAVVIHARPQHTIHPVPTTSPATPAWTWSLTQTVPTCMRTKWRATTTSTLPTK